MMKIIKTSEEGSVLIGSREENEDEGGGIVLARIFSELQVYGWELGVCHPTWGRCQLTTQHKQLSNAFMIKVMSVTCSACQKPNPPSDCAAAKVGPPPSPQS